MAASRERTKKYKDKVYRYTLSEEALENERLSHQRWREEHYERLYVYTPKGMLGELKGLAEKRGVSLRELVISVLRRELDAEKKNLEGENEK